VRLFRSRTRPYRHERPHRPANLPRRLRPPPERTPPPDLSWFLYAGIGLALIVVIVAIPYLVILIIDLLSA
jgi:hypothetical protein